MLLYFFMKENFIVYSFWWVVAVCIDIWLLYFLHDIIEFDIYISALIAFIFSSLFWFFYHKKYSFKQLSLQQKNKNLLVQFGQFIWINSITQSIYMVLLFIWTTVIWIHYLVVAIIAKAIVFLWNFLWHTYITFKTWKHERYILYSILLLVWIFAHYTNNNLWIWISWLSLPQKYSQDEIEPINNEHITRYQIIPDKWANGDVKNDFITTPLDWSQIPQSILEEYKLFQSSWTWDWFSLNPWETKIYNAILQYSRQTLPTEKLAFWSILKFRRYWGDFEGIRNNMSYLENLGISWVILNPVRIANTPIRYDVIDYRHIDPRLSSIQQDRNFSYQTSQWRNWTQADKDFLQLVNDFHSKWIKVMVDFAFTYSAANSIFLEDIARYGKDSKYYDRFEVYMPWDIDYDTKNCSLSNYFSWDEYSHAKEIRMNGRWWFCHLVYVRRDYVLNVHPEYEKFIKQIITRWVEPKIIDWISYDWIDGIRLDAAPELPKKLKKDIYDHIKSLKTGAVLIHEDRKNNYTTIWLHEADWLTSYFTRTLSELFFIGKDRSLYDTKVLTKLLTDEYSKDNRKFRFNMINQLSSHDTDRISSKLIKDNRLLSWYISSDLGWFDLNKIWSYIWDAREINKVEIANKQFIQHQPPDTINTLRNSIIMFQFMLPWSPSIFYGDEVGMWWADDPDNRKPMFRPTMNFAPQSECTYDEITYCNNKSKKQYVTHNTKLLELYKKLISLRKSNKALSYWDINPNISINYWLDTGIISFSRSRENDTVYFVSNQNTWYKNIDIQLNTWIPNSIRQDPITRKSYTADKETKISFTLSPESSIILVKWE